MNQQITELQNRISMGLCGAPGSHYEQEAMQSLARLKYADKMVSNAPDDADLEMVRRNAMRDYHV